MCYPTPRISYGVPETAVRSFWSTSPVVGQWCTGGGVWAGLYGNRWVGQVGNTGTPTPPHAHPACPGPPPHTPVGLPVGLPGDLLTRTLGIPLGSPPGPDPQDHAQDCQDSPARAPTPPSGLNMARFRAIYGKVSVNLGVSPVLCHEAWHTPCFKKPAGSHLLRFSDFHFQSPSLTRNYWS